MDENRGWVVVGPLPRSTWRAGGGFSWSAWAEAGSEQGTADTREEAQRQAEAAYGRVLSRSRRLSLVPACD